MDDTNPPVEHNEAKSDNQSAQFDWIKKINPRYLLIAIIVIAIAGAAFYYKGMIIAATVDGHLITRFSVVKRLEKQSGQNVLDTLIGNQLIENAAESQKIVISPADVNQQLATIKLQVESQGSTLDEALTQANMSLDDLKNQIINELLLEKLLGDKITVTDSEVDKYITDNKVTIPAGQETTMKAQIKDQLVQNKVSQNASAYLGDLKLKAKIKTYVKY